MGKVRLRTELKDQMAVLRKLGTMHGLQQHAHP